MTPPSMAAITASLERSLQNCSLNGVNRSSSSSETATSNRNRQYQQHQQSVSDANVSSSDDNSTLVELNSHVSLPYHWEQCLDLKTGEVYYINWRNGMKSKEDPRTTVDYNGDYYSDEDDDDDDEEEDEDDSYDSEGSFTESSPSFYQVSTGMIRPCPSTSSSSVSGSRRQQQRRQAGLDQEAVLVVAGCKSCLMYYMVPKQVEDCPKCNGQLLHFDRSENANPSTL